MNTQAKMIGQRKNARISKPALINLLLVAGSIGVTYLILEFVLFRLCLPHLPLKLHGYLPPGIQSLAQSSKRSVIPKNYIALVGDSYARGLGDWLLESNPYGNPPYHSGHIVHSKLNIDVVTFGAPGGGSLRGLVTEPIAQWEYVNSTALYSLPPPKEILVYFYSGNDLNDNLTDLRRRFLGRHSMDQVHDTDVFRKFIDEVVLAENETYAESKRRSWKKNLLLARTVYKMLFKERRQPGNTVERAESETTAVKPEPVNWAKIGAEPVALSNKLQAPSLELTREELELAVYVFEQALLCLKFFFSQSRISVLYVPSPLESYEIVSPEVDAQSYEKRGTRFPASFLPRRSLEVKELIETAAQKHGVPFLDATPFIRQASRQSLVHGPKEWKHFNRIGYEALAEAAIQAVSNERAGGR